jgi:hypothetical protein
MTSNPSIYFEEPAGPHPYGGVRNSQTDSIFQFAELAARASASSHTGLNL